MTIGTLNAFSTIRASSFSASDLKQQFIILLKECNSLPNARNMHQQILANGLLCSSMNPSNSFRLSSLSLGVAVVAAYLHCGAHLDSLFMLEQVSPSPIFWWNALIRSDVRLGRLEHALTLCRRMQLVGTKPDHYTFPFVLKACGELPSFRCGTAFHTIVFSQGFEFNVFVCNALVSMYSRCGALGEAQRIFNDIIRRGIDDTISWNSMVAAHAKSGNPHLALKMFAQMSKSNLVSFNSHCRSDVISLVNVLPACASLKAASQVKQIHGYSITSDLISDVYVGNATIDVYAKCGMMGDALKVFDSMELKDLVSWNAMVTGYSQNGLFDDALELFEEMERENIELNVVTWSAVIAAYAQRGHGIEALCVFRRMQLTGSDPNAITIISLLSACASIGASLQGMETHGHALRKGLMMWVDDESGDREDLMVPNALIDMYSKCRRLALAHRLFDSISIRRRNVVTWTVMIGGHAQHGDANVALELFSEMLRASRSAVSPNAFTISCALMACARLSALRLGRRIHAHTIRNYYEAVFVANCLIDMYSKCGDVDMARRVFDAVPHKNAVSWTSLMTGYGMHGRGIEALWVFEEMQKAGFVPDEITFLVVLYACSHSGMGEQGLKYFHNMAKEYNVVAGAEHYACVVDLLGRAGRLDEARNLIDGMPMKPTDVVWVALLSASRVHSNVDHAEYATTRLLESASENDGTYTLLSNIYANAGRWKDVARVRNLMKKSGIKKRPGCSWIEGRKGSVSFYVGDRSHPLSEKIYALLSDLIKRIKTMGYIPQTCFALHDVDDEEKTSLLSEHSEKLALAYGILTSPPGTPIRITKNLRVCGDCHSAITFISKIVDHEIVVRDSSRFHHFKDGACSCCGYW